MNVVLLFQEERTKILKSHNSYLFKFNNFHWNTAKISQGYVKRLKNYTFN